MHVTKHLYRLGQSKGFTLIEMVIGMLVLAIVFALMTSLIFPQAGRSVDPIMQVRATELANSLLREISAKAFDETSTTGIRCNDDLNQDGEFDSDDNEAACTAAANFGPEGETRNAIESNFDDVDDYHGLSQGRGQDDPIILNSLGESIEIDGQNLYAGFNFQVTVVYDGNLDGVTDSNQSAKLITVTVGTPSLETLVFSTYRSNY
ncbi:type II secretion system protein [Aliiglaciecola sp. LCG003]|uniref:type IV pilus modification PilV family protein n=1 Tax=Aliiglaciecola sp. LCG003 TaxID=3053655 RepID=UPI002573AF0D|nr:type II secretion system protein [Aliiglaciecola sp. LCG003]WJG09712.1 type II secretion system protein [Aliiglaciecola sp. LCG003]